MKKYRFACGDGTKGEKSECIDIEEVEHKGGGGGSGGGGCMEKEKSERK